VDLATRFWSKVECRGRDDCWPWTAGTDRYGYGKFAVNIDGRRRYLPAHRVVYLLKHGSLPFVPVLHSCSNRLCCNPGHLSLGTTGENMADMIEDGHSPKGERNGRAKLTRSEVAKMRELAAILEPQHRTLAFAFGVSASTVGKVLRRETWLHV
jgi:hypothetical protein